MAPKEVANALYSLEGVQEVAVVGVPDPIQGQAIKAFVVTAGREMTEARVLAHCRSHLEDFMVPKYVELCNELPEIALGKSQERELQ